MPNMKEALKAKKKMQKILRGVSGISGIGITWSEDGEPCVKVTKHPILNIWHRPKVA